MTNRLLASQISGLQNVVAQRARLESIFSGLDTSRIPGNTEFASKVVQGALADAGGLVAIGESQRRLYSAMMPSFPGNFSAMETVKAITGTPAWSSMLGDMALTREFLGATGSLGIASQAAELMKSIAPQHSLRSSMLGDAASTRELFRAAGGFGIAAQAAEIMNTITPRYSFLQDTFASSLRNLVPFDAGYLRSLFQPLSYWQDFIGRLPIRNRHLAAGLARAQWWLVPSWPMDLCGQLEDLLQLNLPRSKRRRSSGVRVVTGLLLEYYARPGVLTYVVSGWTQREFTANGRGTAFRRAIRDFRAGRYYAVTSGLAPMIEGVLKDYAIAAGHLLTDQDVEKAKPATLYAQHLRSEKVVPGTGFDDEMRRLFERFGWTKPASKRGVRRNPLAHGFRPPTDSPADALRIILVLETVHELIDFHRAARKKVA